MSLFADSAPSQYIGSASELDRLRLALAASDQIVYEWDSGTDRMVWTDRPGAVQIASVLADLPSTGAAFDTYLDPEAVQARREAMERARPGVGRFQLEYRVRAGGKALWFEETGTVTAGPYGRRVVGSLRPTTDRKKREAQLLYLACYDEATGQLTRARLRECLSEALAGAQRDGRPLAFLLVGVDNLALINRAYGFEVADETVVRIAERIERVLPNPTIGRFSSNKFGVVIEDADEPRMLAIADALRRAVRDTVIDTDAGPVAATVSIGCVLLPRVAATSRAAMRAAQEALEQARETGPDSCAVYCSSPARDSGRRRDMAMARAVVRALDEGRLVMAYQPIVNADSREVVEYEGLLRLVQEDGDILVAADFIPTMEKLGLIRLIDHCALELAVAALIEHPTIKLSLNVSALTTSDPTWLAALVRQVDGRANLAPRLTIEITETAAIQDLDESAGFVAALRKLGCRVALDDFGAGYTSFRHLRSLAVDLVKIDGSFVTGLLENADNRLFVRTLVELARNFEMAVVAESVGSEAEADLLRSFGVERFQGFYFGVPEVEPDWRAPED